MLGGDCCVYTNRYELRRIFPFPFRGFPEVVPIPCEVRVNVEFGYQHSRDFFMNQKNELNSLLNFIQKQSSPEIYELTAIVLKMAADSAALNTFKNKVQITDDKTFIKFTKQEVEFMPERIKSFITVNGKVLPCTEVRGMYQLRYNRDGFHINVSSKSQKQLKQKFLDKLREQKKAMQSKVPFVNRINT